MNNNIALLNGSGSSRLLYVRVSHFIYISKRNNHEASKGNKNLYIESRDKSNSYLNTPNFLNRSFWRDI